MDLHGICPGRYTRSNKISPKDIEAGLEALPPLEVEGGRVERTEYGRAYREEASKARPAAELVRIQAQCEPPRRERQEMVILGSAGQRIVTAGELVCLAGASAGLHATQKNDYPITVMRGHSVSELILSSEPVGFTGIERPATVVALAPEGVARRKKMLASLKPEARVLCAAGVALPPTAAKVVNVDFRQRKIKPQDWAVAALALLARENRVLSPEMLQAALKLRFKGTVLEGVRRVADQAALLQPAP
jgi:Pyruvate/2-oxoacid:ferredoxin oxidoreductase gamma subunit